MPRAARRTPSGTGRLPRVPAFIRRDPDLVPLAVVAFALSLVAGAVLFAVASSRGLDLVEALGFSGLVASALLLGLALFAVGRVVMFQDWRAAAVTVALVIGWTGGDALAFRLLPGDATDGAMALAWSDPTAMVTADDRARVPDDWATCHWDPTHQRVLLVTSRRTVGMDPSEYPGRVRLDLAAGTVMVERIIASTGQRIAEERGWIEPTLAEPAGNRGTASIAAVRRITSPDQGVDPAYLDHFGSLPAPERGFATWSCPALP